jgi:hypothetical protein
MGREIDPRRDVPRVVAIKRRRKIVGILPMIPPMIGILIGILPMINKSKSFGTLQIGICQYN